jgi:hypothetical protein
MSQDKKAELIMQAVFVLNGITYVPHYRNREIFVGPGYPKHNQHRYSASDLVQMGAKSSSAALWQRGSFGVVNSTFP